MLCLGGSCGYDSCASGFCDCDGDASNGCERPTANDVNNCGGCGAHCEAEHTQDLACSGTGTCVWTTCAPGWGDCDDNTPNGCESDILHDDHNCGTTCTDCTLWNKTCVAGTCT